MVLIVGLVVYFKFRPSKKVHFTKVIRNQVRQRIKIDTLRYQPSSLIKAIHYVALQTSKECLIGSINKMLIYKDYIYILDTFISRSLFKFDMNGKYITKFNQIGEGPLEVKVILDFSIDTINNQIITYDRSFSGKILILNTDLKPIKYKKTSITLDCISPIANGKYIGSASCGTYNSDRLKNYAYYVLDSNLKVISMQSKHFFPKLSLGLTRYINVDEKMALNFTTMFNNKVYEVMPKGTLKLKYVVDFNKFLTPSEYMINDSVVAKYRKNNPETSGYYFAEYDENSDVASIRYMLADHIYEIFIQKKTGRVRHGFSLQDDYSKIVPYCAMASYKNNFVSSCNADIVYERIQDKKFCKCTFSYKQSNAIESENRRQSCAFFQ